MADELDHFLKDTDPEGAMNKIATLAKKWERRALAAESRSRKRDVVIFWVSGALWSFAWWFFAVR